jgi:hypothetical protein
LGPALMRSTLVKWPASSPPCSSGTDASYRSGSTGAGARALKPNGLGMEKHRVSCAQRRIASATGNDQVLRRAI